MSAPAELLAAARLLSTACTDCGACAAGCQFLRESGSPCHQARLVLDHRASPRTLAPALHCSLCGLCASVCPQGLRPADFFLQLRREAVRRDCVDLRPYRPLLRYEQLGRSPVLADRILPDGCDTVLFPGCTFPGTRPETTLALVRHLRAHIPGLGVVLDCCAKPSHDLGRQDAFAAAFTRLQTDLLRRGVRQVLTVCPNCQSVFERYGQGLQTGSAASLLTSLPRPHERVGHGHGVQHIPCPLRGNTHEIQAVRTLAAQAGLALAPLKHQGRRSPCCGEGGAVGRIRQDLATAWGERCLQRAGTHPLLTSCAGCVQQLRGRVPTIHVLDLYFFPRRTLAGRCQPVEGWRTYLHRLALRIRLRHALSPR